MVNLNESSEVRTIATLESQITNRAASSVVPKARFARSPIPLIYVHGYRAARTLKVVPRSRKLFSKYYFGAIYRCPLSHGRNSRGPFDEFAGEWDILPTAN